MARTKTDTEIYTVTISGTAYEAGIKDRFPIKPLRVVKKGYGTQARYELGREDLRALADLMNVVGCDLADEYGGGTAKPEAVYSDLEKFPSAAW